MTVFIDSLLLEPHIGQKDLSLMFLILSFLETPSIVAYKSQLCVLLICDVFCESIRTRFNDIGKLDLSLHFASIVSQSSLVGPPDFSPLEISQYFENYFALSNSAKNKKEYCEKLLIEMFQFTLIRACPLTPQFGFWPTGPGYVHTWFIWIATDK